MIFPRLNRNGGAISELWKVVRQICEILPDLVVRGRKRYSSKQSERRTDCFCHS